MKRNKWIGLLLLMVISSCEEVLEKELTEKKVVLQAPSNNVITNDSVHNFNWQEMEGAFEYQLQIVSPRFDSIAKLVADTTMTTVIFMDMTLQKGNYQWRVRAKNASTASHYSDPWSLTIQ